jgi:DUF971 family protein
MTSEPTATKLTMKRDQGLEIVWSDGSVSTYPLVYLRTMCPCAACKEVRADSKSSGSSLTILPGNYAEPLTVTAVERVGNYAIRLDWSDHHGSGIYSFAYLREIRREA